MEGGLVDRSLTKWLSVWMSELMYTWPCEHTLNITWWQDISNQQENICLVWLTAGLSNGESEKYDTSDRPLNDRMTLVRQWLQHHVWVWLMIIVNITHTQTFHITRTRLQVWHSNQHAEDNSWENKLKESKTCRGSTWNDFFVFAHMHVTKDRMIWQW